MIVLGIVLLLAVSPPRATTADSTAAPAVRADIAVAPAVHADTILVLPEVRVDRVRPERGARERMPTGFAAELRPGAAGRTLESLADLLSEAPGVRVTQYGGLGAFSTVSLRGAPAGQVAVTLDGTPIQSASQGVVNLSDLPAAPLQRVEVHRGGSPLELGAAPGGTIQLVTRSEARALAAHAARGSFGTLQSNAGGGVERGPLSLVLAGGYLGSAGDYRFDDDNGTPFNAADDSVSARLNNRLDAANGFAALTWRAPFALRAAARHHQFHRAQGLPGIGANPALHPRLALDRTLSQLELARDGEGWMPEVLARAALQRDRSRFRDSAAELRPARADRDDRFRSATAAVESRWPASRRGFSVLGSASWRGERAELHDALNANAVPAPSTRRTHGASLAATLEPWNGRLLLRAARRWDRIVDERGALASAPSTHVAREIGVPQLGARLTLPTGRLPLAADLRGNWTRAERVPDFTELFGDQGSVQGNAALAPERGENWDAGGSLALVGASAWRARAEFAHFESRAENLMVYARNSPSTVRAINVSRAAITGDELTLALAAPGGLSLSAAGTSMRAVDRGAIRAWAGKRLPGRPDRQLVARLEWRRGEWRLAATLDYLGDNYLDPANRRPVEDRTLAGGLVSLPLGGSHLQFTLEGRNLGDRRVVDVGGYPLPGRSVFAALGARFGSDETSP